VGVAAGLPVDGLAVVVFLGAGFFRAAVLAAGLFAADFFDPDFLALAFLVAAFGETALVSWLAAKGPAKTARDIINKAVMMIPEGSPHVAGG
jgi:hypothetical protein